MFDDDLLFTGLPYDSLCKKELQASNNKPEKRMTDDRYGSFAPVLANRSHVRFAGNFGVV
jgi:hypothetical protein